MTVDDRDALAALELRIRTILPEEYQRSYENMQPVPMRSAPVKYGPDGKVAWNEMWATFCDLAMAGGPPHKGTLLEPGDAAAIDAQPERYAQVANEICRGITLATELPAQPSPIPGWVRVTCLNTAMAEWLLRAIAMENVAVRCDGHELDLPVAPHFRLEKEIKNVITVIAKTCHYWLGHLPAGQQQAITGLFAAMADSSPLIEPSMTADGVDAETFERVASGMAERLTRDAGLPRSPHRYAGWLGVECSTVRAAIWIMRALVASNVLARREDMTLFVPVNPFRDPDGSAVVSSLVWTRRLATKRGVP